MKNAEQNFFPDYKLYNLKKMHYNKTQVSRHLRFIAL